MVHQQTTRLVEDLKNFELPAVIPRSPVDQTDFTRQLSSTAAGSVATAVTVSAMLETAMEELFVPYTEGQRYLERESKSLSELYASFLTNFTRYHVRPPS
jgi:exocyst complex component 5